MKKILLILVAIFSFSVFNANAQNLLSEGVKAYRAECPVNLGDGMVLSDVFIAGRNVVMQIKFNDTDGIIDLINQNPQIKGQLSEALIGELGNDPESIIFLGLVADNDKNLVFQMIDKRTGKKTDLTMTAKSMRQFLYN